MVKVIVGKQGTGKTKKIIELANKSALQDGCEVVYIDNNRHHMYELNHDIRFVDTSEFQIRSYCIFYGFICGIVSENFDISKIYIDGIFDIVQEKEDEMESFLKDLSNISTKFSIDFVITMTGNPDEMPDYVKQFSV